MISFKNKIIQNLNITHPSRVQGVAPWIWEPRSCRLNTQSNIVGNLKVFLYFLWSKSALAKHWYCIFKVSIWVAVRLKWMPICQFDTLWLSIKHPSNKRGLLEEVLRILEHSTLIFKKNECSPSNSGPSRKIHSNQLKNEREHETAKIRPSISTRTKKKKKQQSVQCQVKLGHSNFQKLITIAVYLKIMLTDIFGIICLPPKIKVSWEETFLTCTSSPVAFENIYIRILVFSTPKSCCNQPAKRQWPLDNKHYNNKYHTAFAAPLIKLSQTNADIFH